MYVCIGMPITYAQNKIHIYNWRAKNIDIAREHSRRYICFRRICAVFRNILFE